ncbi:GlxA family transcriptional regulator [Mesorhizobium sp.]|uniref:GlxA family transcriptional regulator n=1 Tax=Mesorhizobium sp. TaxID=1871066 RepID=UPI0025BE0642|nr:GlxA family transcriptional regulator [Mesorhizobium sp.]
MTAASVSSDLTMTKEPVSKTFVFYIVPEFTMLAFTFAIEALRLANAIMGEEVYRWRIVSVDGDPVRSSCGLSVSPDRSVAAERSSTRAERPNMIVVCTGWHVERAVDKSVAGWLRQSRNFGIPVAGICTGAYILANAGMLAGRRCTIHWENLPIFRETFPSAIVGSGLIESDDDIHTCVGGTASFDMMLHLIEKDCGRRVALAICEQAIVDRIREPFERQPSPLRTLGSVNPLVLSAVQFMEDSIADQTDIAAVARHIKLSRRQMERLFARELATSPSRYLLELRLDRARLMLLQSSMAIIDVAVACGFVSGSHFAKCYKAFHGVSPQQMRTQRPRSAYVPSLGRAGSRASLGRMV